MNSTAGEPQTNDLEGGMVDISEIPLEQLATSSDTVLAHAMRRLLTDGDDSADPIAGWQSALA